MKLFKNENAFLWLPIVDLFFFNSHLLDQSIVFYTSRLISVCRKNTRKNRAV
ncbi:hypothetical protein BY458DRAFT_511155 [Sporodiniella umbellata]|nr:hypothetical protein BY458DRAFT_511155 [Sporodiniella umbellata]